MTATPSPSQSAATPDPGAAVAADAVDDRGAGATDRNDGAEATGGTAVSALVGLTRVDQPTLHRGIVDEPLLTIAELDAILAWQALSVPEIVYLMCDGDPVPASHYTKTSDLQYRPASVPGVSWSLAVLDPDAAIDQVVNGGTLALNGINRHVPRLEGLLRRITRHHGTLCSANVYLSGPGAAGGLHHDSNEVIAVQLVGSKVWQIHERPPGWSDPATVGQAGEVHDSYLVVAGDVLQIPAGWPHLVTTPIDDWSLHLTIGIRPLAVAELAHRHRVVRFDDAPLAGAELSDPARFADAIDRGTAAVRDRSSTERLRLAALRTVHRSGPPDGRLRAAMGGDPVLRGGELLVPRGAPWLVTVSSDDLVVEAEHRSVTLPGEAGSLISPLSNGHPVSVDALADTLGQDGTAVLVKLLVAEGLVRVEA